MSTTPVSPARTRSVPNDAKASGAADFDAVLSGLEGLDGRVSQVLAITPGVGVRDRQQRGSAGSPKNSIVDFQPNRLVAPGQGGAPNTVPAGEAPGGKYFRVVTPDRVFWQYATPEMVDAIRKDLKHQGYLEAIEALYHEIFRTVPDAQIQEPGGGVFTRRDFDTYLELKKTGASETPSPAQMERFATLQRRMEAPLLKAETPTAPEAGADDPPSSNEPFGPPAPRVTGPTADGIRSTIATSAGDLLARVPKGDLDFFGSETEITNAIIGKYNAARKDGTLKTTDQFAPFMRDALGEISSDAGRKRDAAIIENFADAAAEYLARPESGAEPSATSIRRLASALYDRFRDEVYKDGSPTNRVFERSGGFEAGRYFVGEMDPNKPDGIFNDVLKSASLPTVEPQPPQTAPEWTPPKPSLAGQAAAEEQQRAYEEAAKTAQEIIEQARTPGLGFGKSFEQQIQEAIDQTSDPLVRFFLEDQLARIYRPGPTRGRQSQPVAETPSPDFVPPNVYGDKFPTEVERPFDPNAPWRIPDPGEATFVAPEESTIEQTFSFERTEADAETETQGGERPFAEPEPKKKLDADTTPPGDLAAKDGSAIDPEIVGPNEKTPFDDQGKPEGTNPGTLFAGFQGKVKASVAPQNFVEYLPLPQNTKDALKAQLKKMGADKAIKLFEAGVSVKYPVYGGDGNLVPKSIEFHDGGGSTVILADGTEVHSSPSQDIVIISPPDKNGERTVTLPDGGTLGAWKEAVSRTADIAKNKVEAKAGTRGPRVEYDAPEILGGYKSGDKVEVKFDDLISSGLVIDNSAPSSGSLPLPPADQAPTTGGDDPSQARRFRLSVRPIGTQGEYEVVLPPDRSVTVDVKVASEQTTKGTLYTGPLPAGSIKTEVTYTAKVENGTILTSAQKELIESTLNNPLENNAQFKKGSLDDMAVILDKTIGGTPPDQRLWMSLVPGQSLEKPKGIEVTITAEGPKLPALERELARIGIEVSATPAGNLSWKFDPKRGEPTDAARYFLNLLGYGEVPAAYRQRGVPEQVKDTLGKVFGKVPEPNALDQWIYSMEYPFNRTVPRDAETGDMLNVAQVRLREGAELTGKERAVLPGQPTVEEAALFDIDVFFVNGAPAQGSTSVQLANGSRVAVPNEVVRMIAIDPQTGRGATLTGDNHLAASRWMRAQIQATQDPDQRLYLQGLYDRYVDQVLDGGPLTPGTWMENVQGWFAPKGLTLSGKETILRFIMGVGGISDAPPLVSPNTSDGQPDRDPWWNRTGGKKLSSAEGGTELAGDPRSGPGVLLASSDLAAVGLPFLDDGRQGGDTASEAQLAIDLTQPFNGLIDPQELAVRSLGRELPLGGAPEEPLGDIAKGVAQGLSGLPGEAGAAGRSLQTALGAFNTAQNLFNGAVNGEAGDVRGLLLPNGQEIALPAGSRLVETPDKQSAVVLPDGSAVPVADVLRGPDALRKGIDGLADLAGSGLFGKDLAPVGRGIGLVNDAVTAVENVETAERALDLAKAGGNADMVTANRNLLDQRVADVVGTGFSALGLVGKDDKTLSTIAQAGGVGVDAFKAVKNIEQASSALRSAKSVGDAPGAATAGKQLASSVLGAVDVGFSALGLLAGDNQTLKDISKFGSFATSTAMLALNPTPLGAVGFIFGLAGLFGGGKPKLIELTDKVDVTGDGSNDTVSFRRKKWDYRYKVNAADDGLKVSELRFEVHDVAVKKHKPDIISRGSDRKNTETRYFLNLDAVMQDIFPGVTGVDGDRATLRLARDGGRRIDGNGIELTETQHDKFVARFGEKDRLVGPQAQEVLDFVREAARDQLDDNSVTFNQKAAAHGLNFLLDVNGDGILDRVQQFMDLKKLDGPRYENQPALIVNFRDADGQEVRSISGEDLEQIARTSVLEPYTLAYVASHADLIAAFGADLEGNLATATRHFMDNGEARGITFDASDYLLANPDVLKAFGADGLAAARHYIQHGHAEGRATRVASAESLRAHDAIADDPGGYLDRLSTLVPGLGEILKDIDPAARDSATAAAITDSLLRVVPQSASLVATALAAPSEVAREAARAAAALPAGYEDLGASIGNRELTAKQFLSAPNKQFFAVFQDDGNFVVYAGQPGKPGDAIWASGTDGDAAGGSLWLQGDGNLVAYDAGNEAKWASKTSNGDANRAFSLALQDDGNLVLTDPTNGDLLWTSKGGRAKKAEGNA